MGGRSFCGSGGERRDWLRGFFLKAGQRRFESDRENLVHGVDEMQLHGIAQVFGNLGDIFFVVLGQNHFE